MVKKPFLFYFEDAVSNSGAWIPVPELVEEIINTDNFDSCDEQEVITLQFKVFRMTDEEFAALPIE